MFYRSEREEIEEAESLGKGMVCSVNGDAIHRLAVVVHLEFVRCRTDADLIDFLPFDCHPILQ